MVPFKKRILVIGSQCIKKQSSDLKYQLGQTFSNSISCAIILDYNKGAVVQCLGPFTMLLLEGSSETELFRHLSNHVFRSLYFWKYISYEGHVFSKFSELEIDFKNEEKI